MGLNFGVGRAHDYGARWYDASIGRWTSVDPLADWAPEQTPYRYGFNDPIQYTDPYGLFETKREARRYRRKEKGLSWWRGDKIKKNRKTGRFDIHYGEGTGRITRNENGDIEFFTGSYKSTIQATKINVAGKMRDSGFLGSWAYDIADAFSVNVQTLAGPFVSHERHLDGSFVRGMDRVNALQATVGDALPMGKGLKATKLVMPKGLRVAKILNTAQFSSKFKGTTIARLRPKARGRVNRIYNFGAKWINGPESKVIMTMEYLDRQNSKK